MEAYRAPFRQYYNIHLIVITARVDVDNTLKIIDTQLKPIDTTSLVPAGMNSIVDFPVIKGELVIPFPIPLRTKYLTIGFTNNTTTNLDISVTIFYTLRKGTKPELIYDFIRKRRRS